jgi:hypothetical protein
MFQSPSCKRDVLNVPKRALKDVSKCFECSKESIERCFKCSESKLINF